MPGNAQRMAFLFVLFNRGTPQPPYGFRNRFENVHSVDISIAPEDTRSKKFAGRKRKFYYTEQGESPELRCSFQQGPESPDLLIFFSSSDREKETHRKVCQLEKRKIPGVQKF